AMDGISLAARRGEMICVMGPSGCGKSTFLRILSGHLQPSHGRVTLNSFSLYQNHHSLTPYISYVPQEDAFDEHLTIQENIDYAAAIRSPNLGRRERRRRVDAKLVELGLNERRHRLAGAPKDKFLSGGERKRLNVGMDMIGLADVYLFDEPTSGLSSKDSEHVLEILQGLSRHKIVFVSIHQPSARLFRMFDKAILLDRGGKLAFFGTPNQMMYYFEMAQEENVVPLGQAGTTVSLTTAETAAPTTPDFIFDVLETPLRDLSGAAIYEEDKAGHLSPSRRFAPDFWRDRFQAHRTMREVKRMDAEDTRTHSNAPVLPTRPTRNAKEKAMTVSTFFQRSFLSKLRNRGNVVTTLLEAPMLALLISLVLRWSEEDRYTFGAAFHIPTYLFLSLVVAMFLGLTNSADEIIRDRALLTRERNLGSRLFAYLGMKMLSLSLFAALQCAIYVLIGNAVLEIRGMFFYYFLWLFLTTICGVAVGLFVSTIVDNVKTALNVIPLILLPQIILGGNEP
ncbi:MAG: ATP-binding cassette domain-containing protein, partial [Verrucomicrobiales bacterium]